MENKTNDDIIQNLKNTAFWKRLLFMALFAVAYTVAKFAACAVILFLIFSNLLTGNSNERALLLGRQLSAYIYHILLYLTYNTEERPFPLTDWPIGVIPELDQPSGQKTERPAAATPPPQSPGSSTTTTGSGPGAAKENFTPEGNETDKPQ